MQQHDGLPGLFAGHQAVEVGEEVHHFERVPRRPDEQIEVVHPTALRGEAHGEGRVAVALGHAQQLGLGSLHQGQEAALGLLETFDVPGAEGTLRPVEARQRAIREGFQIGRRVQRGLAAGVDRHHQQVAKLGGAGLLRRRQGRQLRAGGCGSRHGLRLFLHAIEDRHRHGGNDGQHHGDADDPGDHATGQASFLRHGRRKRPRGRQRGRRVHSHHAIQKSPRMASRELLCVGLFRRGWKGVVFSVETQALWTAVTCLSFTHLSISNRTR